MSWGFEIGRVYNRRNDIHARFGGQQQGEIITPKDHPLVIIITGEEGLQHGYADRLRPDGVFEYFGEGQVGDMQLIVGNTAVADHSASGESLLLFRKTVTGLRFEGEVICGTIHYERSPDRQDNDRNAIVFELRPFEAISEIVDEQGAPPMARHVILKGCVLLTEAVDRLAEARWTAGQANDDGKRILPSPFSA